MNQFTNETRRESYQLSLLDRSTRQLEVLETLAFEPAGLTAEEIADRLARPSYTIRPRLTELLGLGKVITFGKRLSPTTNRNIAVWRTTEVF